MALDLIRDARRLRLGMLVGCLALLASLLAVGLVAGQPQWRRLQVDYAARGLGPHPVGRAIGRTNCLGETDRCISCHLGCGQIDPAAGRGVATGIPPVFQPHPQPLQSHLGRGFGCGVCHGGTGRALAQHAAHAAPGATVPDPLLTAPHIQASCRRCHVPGAEPGMEKLVRGADLYLGLGCAVCHPLAPGGRGGWDYGPDLRAIGRRSLADLRTSVLDPAANFPATTMPSFAISFAEDPVALEELLIFLQSLPLDKAAPHCQQLGQESLVGQPCAICHVAASRNGRFAHRCVFILDRADAMRCSVCHATGPPEPGSHGGFCPLVTSHRSACAACHDSGIQRGGRR